MSSTDAAALEEHTGQEISGEGEAVVETAQAKKNRLKREKLKAKAARDKGNEAIAEGAEKGEESNEQAAPKAKAVQPKKAEAKAAAKAAAKPLPAAARLALQRLEAERELQRKEQEAAEAQRLAEEEEARRAAELAEARERRREETAKRREEAKKSGKVLTAKQKHDQARIQELLKATAVAAPTGAGAERPGGRKKKTQKRTDAAETRDEGEVEHLACAAAPDADSSDLGGAAAVEDWRAIINNPVEAKAEESAVPGLPAKSLAIREVQEKATQKPPIARASTLRSPICCVLGHVDTGKTKLLDKIRNTQVQAQEAGGITQQIGATFFPSSALSPECHKVFPDLELKVPGLLIIDTPGHESFNNLRKRGSSLCDIAILVVDLMHGLERQTEESIELLRDRKCPFIIALNKSDLLYGWEPLPNAAFKQSLDSQMDSTREEFKTRYESAKLQLAQKGLNTELHWENSDPRQTVNIAPSSAMSGEGIPDLLGLLVRLTQDRMLSSITSKEEFECTVLEVKREEDASCSIDVILVSGVLKEGDRIVLCSSGGPVDTRIRALLTPHGMKELRVKGKYDQHKEVRGSMGLRINANKLDDVLPGTTLKVIDPKATETQVQEVGRHIMKDVNDVFSKYEMADKGVYVMARTLGSLEALTLFLQKEKIPIWRVQLGSIRKADVLAAAIMKDKGLDEFAVILGFDVGVEDAVQKLADESGVRIFMADIIYHLLDGYVEYKANLHEEKKRRLAPVAVFPGMLAVQDVYRSASPTIVGVEVIRGSIRNGVQVVFSGKGESKYTTLGTVTSVKMNDKAVSVAKKGQQATLKIEHGPSNVRGLDDKCTIWSRITRQSIDALKEVFRNDVEEDEWRLIIELKTKFGIL